MKRIIVLGGGYGGLLTAKGLAKKLKAQAKKQEVQIQLVDKNPYHTMLTELHEVVADRVPEDSIRLDLKKIFAHRPVEVILDEIDTIDFKKNCLLSVSKDEHGDSVQYPYDYLVVGSGCQPTYWGIPGAAENAYPLWSYQDAIRLKERVLNQFRQAMHSSDAKIRKKLLSFVVVGGGFTGIEMIGELAEYVPGLCQQYAIAPSEVSLFVMDALPKILPIFPDPLIQKAQRKLRQLGVCIITGAKITEVSSQAVHLGDGTSVEASTVIWAAGVEGSPLMQTMELEKNGRGRIVTNEFLESVDYPNVYAVGDNVFYIPKGQERPVPQMVENAEHSSSTVVHNLCASLNGSTKKEYAPVFHGAMVCIGGRYGVAEVGTGKSMFQLSGFFAMFVKHFINLVYFMQVAGLNKCWSYLMYEIFHIRDNRSFVGGHFAKGTPNFFLVPLRLFVGVMWILEGYHKLPGLLKNPWDIYLIPSPVNAVTAASAAASTVASAALPVPGFISTMVTWMMNTFFYTPDLAGFTTLAMLFQSGMIIAELIVGLMLFGGFLTPLAAAISLMMGLMIWSSGMASPEMLWYIFAAVALLGNAGNVFGIDYYLVPWIHKTLKRIPFFKKWYLYID